MPSPRPIKVQPSPRMRDSVWRWGVAVVLALWAAIVASLGWASGRPLDVACDAKLLAPFLLFLCGWTGAWLSARSTTGTQSP